jgi:hypothetical protein
MKIFLLLLVPCTCLASPNGPYPYNGGSGSGASNQISGSGVVDWPGTTGVATTTFDATGTNVINSLAQGVVSSKHKWSVVNFTLNSQSAGIQTPNYEANGGGNSNAVQGSFVNLTVNAPFRCFAALVA